MSNDDSIPIEPTSLGLQSSSSIFGVKEGTRGEYVEDATSTDTSDPQLFGRTFINSLFRILKIGSIYDPQHNQTRIATDEFMEFFNEAMAGYDEDAISIIIRDELAVVNGESLRLRRKGQQRLNELRDLFSMAPIRGLLLKRGMTTDDLLYFLGMLREVSRSDENMEHVLIETIEIEHGLPTRNIIEAIMNVNKAMYVAHVYIRGLVKLKNTHDNVRFSKDADVPTGVIRRVMQSISELLADEDFTILGLLPLRMVPPDLSSHSMNSAIYGMIMADRLGLSPQMTSYIGMTIIYQDLDRLVGVTVAHRDKEELEEPVRQFSLNLRDVAKMLPRVKGDIISTLRVLVTYERGCRFDATIPRPFYRRDRHLHLAPRIIDLVRTYDLLIQGLEGYKTRRPDLAIQYIDSRAGDVFDPILVKLMVSTLGVFPIGTTVQLSSGEKAVVIKTPNPSQDPRRPVVRILNTSNPATIDLSESSFRDIEITGSIDIDPSELTVSKIFLLS